MARKVAVYALTPERWGDLDQVFGPNGASGGCWCMFFRLRRKQFERSCGEPNKAGLKAIAD